MSPYIKHPSVVGYATWDELLYHIVRCNLVHKGAVDKSVVFRWGNEIALLDTNKILLPAELLQGLIFAVMGSVSNKDERFPEKCEMDIRGQIVDWDTLWGNKALIMSLLTKR